MEDIGAANFIAPLVNRAGYAPSWNIFARGTAAALLLQRQIPFAHAGKTSVDRMLDRARAGIVVVGTASNPRTQGLELVLASRARQIPTIGVVDATMNSRRRFSGGGKDPLRYAPDWILVPDGWTRAAYVALGATPDRVIATGNPHFDYVAQLRRTWRKRSFPEFRAEALPAAATHRKVVVFASEGATRHSGRMSPAGRTEAALKTVLEALGAVHPRPYFILRAHPADGVDAYDQYRRQVDYISRSGPALPLVYAADLIVGQTSMLLTEASLLGRPVVAVTSSAVEARWLPAVRAGLVRNVRDPRALRRELSRELGGQKRRGVEPLADRLQTGATRRVQTLIKQLLKGKGPDA